MEHVAHDEYLVDKVLLLLADLLRSQPLALDVEGMLRQICLGILRPVLEVILRLLAPEETACVDQVTEEMTLYAVDIDVEMLMAVLVGYLLYIEHRFKFFETMADDVFLPYIVVDTSLAMLIGAYAIVARRRLVHIDGGVVEEEELTL